MADVIRLLPDSIANQIAAGEVVQRPASVVKELLENSLDAGATSITLIVKDAGKSQVQVIDNGKGMSLTDARMSFERHATSKIRTAQDLFHVKSMGFRGEALASIAAVSQTELKTRLPDEELGTCIRVEGSEVKSQEPTTTPSGTSICVKNLFYNIPARRNFLKSNPVELRHINDEFHRVALAAPHVRFVYRQNDIEVHQLEPAKLGKRIVQLFGKNYAKQLIPCQEGTDDIKVTGYVGKPEFARKTRGEQFFFINNRFIKNPYLNHAVTNAYQGMMQDDHHPFYVLFIEMEPQHVDINVHPTKTEVKFDDDRLLYGVISAAVRQALGAFNVAPSLDFETDVNFHQFIPRKDVQQPSTADQRYGSFKTIEGNRSARNWEMLYASADQEDERSRIRAIEEVQGQKQVVISSSLNESPMTESKTRKFTLQIHGKYLARQIKSGMVLIDQCAAHERILYERYLTRARGKEGVSQRSLFPQQVDLNSADMALITEIKSEIHKLGFDFEALGTNCIVINGVPPEIVNSSEKEIFEGLIEQFKSNQSKLDLKSNENLARSLAKRTSIRIGHDLQETEINELFDQLFACEQPNFTPDGSPTFVVLSLDKLASLFN